jgi:prepilin-type N-terminal cleavage/methylation domain-containing protein
MTHPSESLRSGPRLSRGGFTMIEVMLAIVITAVVVTGIIGLYKIEVTASSYSRHSTEAAALAEDKLEKLRTLGAAANQTGTDTNIDPQDNVGAGIYTRTWLEVLCAGPLSAPTPPVTATSGTPCTASASPTIAEIIVTVAWSDDGIAHSLTVFGRRGLL